MTVPAPFRIVQVSPTGCVATVTLYGAPDDSRPGKAKAPSMAIGSKTVPSLSVTLVPAARPATVPPTDDTDTQVTLTVLMVSPLESMDPLPLYTVQTCPVGCVNTGTA